MTAAAAKNHGGPSHHTPSNKLEDQGTPPRTGRRNIIATDALVSAATAALYVTKGKGKSLHPLLDDDGKLSSAGVNLNISGSCLPALMLDRRCNFAEIRQSPRPPFISFSWATDCFCRRSCKSSRHT